MRLSLPSRRALPGLLCHGFCLKSNDIEARTPAFLLLRLPGAAQPPCCSRPRPRVLGTLVHAMHGLPFAFRVVGALISSAGANKTTVQRLSYTLLYFHAASVVVWF